MNTKIINFSSKKGMAMLEALPIILVMFVLMGATLGSWGIVHTAILNSIAARNGLFFYFNHRSDLSYIRDFGLDYGGLSTDTFINYKSLGKRTFNIESEKRPDASQSGTYATQRKVNFSPLVDYDATADLKNRHSDIDNHPVRSGQNQVKTELNLSNRRHQAWVMVGYGICLNAQCSP